MRVLLALSLLALLAAPALGKGERPPHDGPPHDGPGPWPKPPRPLKVHGAVLANSRAINFAGKRVIWESPADGSKINIVSNPTRANLTWSLVGLAGVGDDILTESLYSVAWAFGSVVNATIDPVTNKLAVNFYGDGGRGAKAVAIKEGRTFTLGPMVTIKYAGGRNHDRKVEITVKNLPISIEITQPFIKGARKWDRGSYAEFLTVRVSTLIFPGDELTGILPVLPLAP